MNPLYKFPEITHLDDVWPLVKDQEAFYLKDVGSYKVVSYRTIFGNPFPDPVTEKAQMARECRGLIFDRQGKLISRPFHKFMNLGEDLHSKRLLPHLVRAEDKLDGSLVRPVLLEGKVVWMTKGGHTDTAKLCESLIGAMLTDQDLEEVRSLLDTKTPLFEFVGPLNRHVVAYRENSLRLLAVRDNLTGAYVDLDLSYSLNKYKTETVNLVDPSVEQLAELAVRFQEGVVGVTACGHRVKVKNAKFLALHRAKDSMASELFVFNLVRDWKVDDLVASGVLQDVDRDRLLRYSELFWKTFHCNIQKVVNWCEGKIETTSRRDFAFEVQTMPKVLHGFLWEAYRLYHDLKDEPDLDWVWEFQHYVQKEFKTHNNKQMEQWKWWIDNLDWSRV